MLWRDICLYIHWKVVTINSFHWLMQTWIKVKPNIKVKKKYDQFFQWWKISSMLFISLKCGPCLTSSLQGFMQNWHITISPFNVLKCYKISLMKFVCISAISCDIWTIIQAWITTKYHSIVIEIRVGKYCSWKYLWWSPAVTQLLLIWPGACPTKHISIEFEIRWKFKTL